MSDDRTPAETVCMKAKGHDGPCGVGAGAQAGEERCWQAVEFDDDVRPALREVGKHMAADQQQRKLDDLARAIERDEVLKRLDAWIDGGDRRHVTVDGRLRKPNLTFQVTLVDRGEDANTGYGSSHDLATAIERALQDVGVEPPEEQGEGGGV